MMKKNIQINRGYTLLFAVLVSSVLLSVGISILNISKKEFLIATSARDSSSAFYAADAGLECAIYADDPSRDRFNMTTAVAAYEAIDMLPCILPKSLIAADAVGADPRIFTFHVLSGSADEDILRTPADLAGKSCAVVVVSKSKIIENGVDTGRIRTRIESRGYNTGWKPDSNPQLTLAKGTCELESAKRVERGMGYTY